MVLIVTIGPAIDCSEPGSPELEAVSGEGERAGPVAVARDRWAAPEGCRRRSSGCPSPWRSVAPPLAIWSNTSVSWSPRKIEMMAGGASLAPSRWSLVAEATDARSRPPYLWTERMTAAQNTRNWALSCGVSPGRRRLPSVELPSEKLTCLPDPLMPVERLLVEQALHAVLLGHPLHGRHQQLLVVGGHVGPLEHGGQLELARGHLVVAGLGRDSQLEQLPLGVEHEGQDPLGDGAEVVVVELLALGRPWPRTACGPQLSRSGRERKKLRSIRKYSCSAPGEGHHGVGVARGRRARSTRSACLAIACWERSSGVLWSRASPVMETKTVGMHRVLPFGFSRM